MSEEAERCVALIGSSGGGTATLGHTEPADFIKILTQELENIVPPVRLSNVLFVSLVGGGGMDSSTGAEDAMLHYLFDGILNTEHGTLEEVNKWVSKLEVQMSKKIRQGKIHGLISVSSKPPLFCRTLIEATAKDLPLTGTGGTSLSLASALYGIRLIGNSGGSVATTSLTKAISFSSAFAREWNLEYSPGKKKNEPELDPAQATGTVGGSVSTTHHPSWTSVLNSCLPAFWAVVLLKRLVISCSVQGWIQVSSELVQTLENRALPTVCAVVMANSRNSSPGVLMGAALAASACPRTILGGLLAGWLVSRLEEYLLHQAIVKFNTPATMTNLLSSGLVGVVVALILQPAAEGLSAGTALFRERTIYWLAEPRSDDLEILRTSALCMLGATFCFGSKIGWYHSVFLPIILVEMETGDASIFGSIDFLTLVLVSAGICAGAIVAGYRRDTALMKRGLTINLLCGDFIELCYPFMEEDICISLAGYIASTVSTAMLTNDCKSSAYLPFPIAVWLANDWERLSLACCVAAGLPFIVTLFRHFWSRYQAAET